MHLTATVDDGRAERLHDLREAVRPDVRVRVDQDIGRRTVVHQHVEHVADGAALGRAGVELPVGERAGAALAEAVVVLRVDDPRACDPGDGVTASADVGSALEDDRPEPALDQRERREQPGGTRPHDHGRRCTADVTESRRRRRLGPERLVDPHPDAEHAHGRSLPRVERTPHDDVVRDRARRDAEPVRETVRALRRVVVRIGGESDLGLGDHLGRRGREARRGMLLVNIRGPGNLLAHLGLLVAPRLMRTGIEGERQSKGRPSLGITVDPYSSTMRLGATMHER